MRLANISPMRRRHGRLTSFLHRRFACIDTHLGDATSSPSQRIPCSPENWPPSISVVFSSGASPPPSNVRHPSYQTNIINGETAADTISRLCWQRTGNSQVDGGYSGDREGTP